MSTRQTLADLPNHPAVYALMGGHGARAYVAYVGIAGRLRKRIAQHLILRDSSVTTGTSAASLNPDYVTSIRWWEHSGFDDRTYLEAAELIALEVLDPALRSRGAPSEGSLQRARRSGFKRRMTVLFEGEPKGTLEGPTLQTVLDRLAEIERRLALLEGK